MFNNVIAVRERKIVYRDGDFAVKLFDENYSKSDILNEALNQSRIEDTELNIPKITEIKKIDGKWAIVLEFIEGKTLDTLMAENPEKKAEYLELFVDLQVKMHTQKSSLLNRLKDKMKRKIGETSLDSALKYDLYTQLASMPNHNKVCHGDFNPSNIIIANDGMPYIIDWSHVTQGNASADVANTYLKFYMNDRDTAEAYLDLFCKKTDTEKQYVKAWASIVAAVESLKAKPEEQEFLLSWINVVDYQ